MDSLPDEMLEEIFLRIQVERSSSLSSIRLVCLRFLSIVTKRLFHKIDLEEKEINKEEYYRIKELGLKGDTFSIFMNGYHSILSRKLLIWSCTYGIFDLFLHSFSFLEKLRRNNLLYGITTYSIRRGKIGKMVLDGMKYRLLLKKCIIRAIMSKSLQILNVLSSIIHFIFHCEQREFLVIFDFSVDDICERYHTIKDDMNKEGRKALKEWLISFLGINHASFKYHIVKMRAYCRRGDIQKVLTVLQSNNIHLYIKEYEELLVSACKGENSNMLDYLLQNGKVFCSGINSFSDAISLLNEYPPHYLLAAYSSGSSIILQYLLDNMYGEMVRREIEDYLEDGYIKNKNKEKEAIMYSYLNK